MMLGVVASNGENVPPLWFPRDYRLTAAAYKGVLVTKILPRVRNITRNARMRRRMQVCLQTNGGHIEETDINRVH